MQSHQYFLSRILNLTPIQFLWIMRARTGASGALFLGFWHWHMNRAPLRFALCVDSALGFRRCPQYFRYAYAIPVAPSSRGLPLHPPEVRRSPPLPGWRLSSSVCSNALTGIKSSQGFLCLEKSLHFPVSARFRFDVLRSVSQVPAPGRKSHVQSSPMMPVLWRPNHPESE